MPHAPPHPADLELNGLPGPSHNYAGLSFGNVASERHRAARSFPRDAALQVLALAERLLELGVPQGWLPPQERPRLDLLRQLGYDTRPDALGDTLLQLPEALLAAVWSASPMWTANAATVAPACDTVDGRTRFVVANLVDRVHRSLEAEATRAALGAAFANPARFDVLGALPPHRWFGDEGAANHTRLASPSTGRVAHLFVYGVESDAARAGHSPTRYPARQSRFASEHVARRLALRDDVDRVFWPQSRRAIDAGVFHNDVICVGHGELLLVHEDAFDDLDALSERLRRSIPELRVVCIPRAELSLADAVATYLFNSRLVSDEAGRWILVAPEDCRKHAAAARVAESLVAAGHVDEVLHFDLRESMRNGGGPACLRLRVPLAEADRALVRPETLLDAPRIERLRAVVRTHWPESLGADELRDPERVRTHAAAMEALRAVM